MLTLSYNGRIYSIHNNKQENEFDIVDGSEVIVKKEGVTTKVEAIGVVGGFNELPGSCTRVRLFIVLSDNRKDNKSSLYLYNGSTYQFIDGEISTIEVRNEIGKVVDIQNINMSAADIDEPEKEVTKKKSKQSKEA